MSGLEALEAAIVTRFGLTPRPGWGKELERAVGVMARQAKTSIDRLVGQVIADPGRMRDLCSHLTVGESYFMRDSEDFKHFSTAVTRLFPDLNPGDRIRVWSAGCARGEEAYSAAISMTEALGQRVFDRIEITGTDIDASAISVAKSGMYAPWSLRGVPERMVARYFDKTSGDRYRLSSDICRLVEFRHMAISEHLRVMAPGSLDFVFFRNVGIYFRLDTLGEVYRALARALKPTGILYLGASDPRPDHELFCTADGARVSTLRPASRGAVPIPTWREPLTPAASDRTNKASAPQNFDVYGDLTSLEEAARAAQALIRKTPGGKLGFLLNARVALARSRLADACRDLRKVLYLDPTDRFARFWYSQALQLSGKKRQAMANLRELCSVLDAVPPNTILEDSATKASELRTAAECLLRSIE